MQCWAVNVKGQMALLRAALPIFNANPEGDFVFYSDAVLTSKAGP
jgi:hypothetical protein